MEKDIKEFIKKTTETLQCIDYVKPANLPNIDLYMDQITTFMDSQLEASKRHSEDKILTKTMINNYAKNSVLPPPEKKKYTKEHIVCLIFIYYLKNILSISDIQKLLNPMTDEFFGKEEGEAPLHMTDIYQEIVRLEREETKNLLKDITRKYQISQKTFAENTDLKEEDLEFLQTFAFVSELSFDIYAKKMLLEKIIDALPERGGEE